MRETGRVENEGGRGWRMREIGRVENEGDREGGE